MITHERTILVTGGAGFIGSHTCKRLARAGYIPVVFDNLSTGHRDAVKFGPYVHGDICDRQAIHRALMEWKPQAVIHFAACAYVGESVAEPDRYYRNNVVGTLTLLEAMRLTGLTDIVFSSSCATYGSPDELPIRETTAQRPINPYGETKLTCERMLRDFTNAYGFRHVVLRYFNACGADRDGELSERHDPETHLIPRALMAASGRLKQIDLFGADYNTPDGTCIRDYIHVEDLADGHMRALEYINSNQPALSVNIGSGKGASVIEILASIQRVTGKEVPTRTLPRRPGDPAALYADVRLAREKLGFQTKYSDIETIIRTAARSFGFTIM